MTQIIIPTPALVVLVGPAGCGKSTFAAQQFLPTEVVSSDAMRAQISDDPTDQRVSESAFSLVYAIVAERLLHKRLAVIDATNVTPKARAAALALAAECGVPAIALLFSDVSLEQCRLQNAQRSRRVPDHVIGRHFDQMVETLEVIETEGFDAVHPVTADTVVQVGTTPIITAIGWDVIGDVHGCWAELSELIDTLGYELVTDGTHTGMRHPEGRRLAFVGDYTDRGPKSVSVLNVVKWLTMDGHVGVRGNHCDKLRRALKGNKIRVGHGLSETLTALDADPQADKASLLAWLEALPYCVKLRSHVAATELVLSHAGIPRAAIGRSDKRTLSHCLYGEVLGFREDGLPERGESWRESYVGTRQIAVFGHTPVPEVDERDGSVNVDTGCVFGGKLSAYRWPQCEVVSVAAQVTYADK